MFPSIHGVATRLTILMRSSNPALKGRAKINATLRVAFSELLRQSRRHLIASGIVFLFLCGTGSAQTESVPLPCVPAKQNDTRPWNHNSAILESYPSDKSKRYVGAFRDKSLDYQLEIYRDANGIFGQLLSPVVDADSPTSRLYNAFFDPKLGTLRFEARFPSGNLQFTGVLRGRIVRGTVTGNGQSREVFLSRVKLPAEDSYISRAQFDCAMILFHRY